MPNFPTDPLALFHLVQQSGKNPRVHPNGFLQLDLSEVEGEWAETHQRGHSGASLRLHIWNPPGITLPHQGTVNEVHDHVFDMRSTVIRGTLVQRLYAFEVGAFGGPPTHELYRAVYSGRGDSRLQALGVSGHLRERDAWKIPPGDSYIQPAFTFHDSDAKQLVVTVMEKTKVHDGEASVICPIGTEPDNSFDRASAAPKELLWEAIERSLLS